MDELNSEVVALVAEFAEECRAGRAGHHTLIEYVARATTEANRRAVMSLGETALLLGQLFKMRRGELEVHPAKGQEEGLYDLHRPAHNN